MNLKKPKITIKEEGTVKKVYQGETYMGSVEKLAKDCWSYTNILGNGGQTTTEYSAFIQLGFRIT